MKVLVTLDIPEVGIDMLKEAGLEVEVWEQPNPMTAGVLLEKSQDFQALLCTGMDAITHEFLQSCSHLKIISQFGAGYDNIDVSTATSLGIPVGNTPGAMSDATADMSFLLMLAVSRKITHMHKSIISNQWGYFEPKAHLGMELKGKTLGIFGMGRIGLEMAKRCRGAYDMNIIYCSRNAKATAEVQLPAHRVDFDELLKKSDVLSVHCALNESTRSLFDIRAFRVMKDRAIFINTSRGPVHNESDLIRALNSREIWGAGLDVTDPEPMHADNPLLSMENVVVTPHIGSATIEARDEMSRLAAENIIQCFQGKPITNQVN